MASGAANRGKGRGVGLRIAIWVVASLLLLLPLVAMQFTDEVQWDGADFLLIGAMLALACGAYELAARKSGSTVYRAAIGLALLTAFLLTWMNLAVGIIGSEDNPANLIFFGVVAVGIVGAVLARFRPRGMARALIATAIAQALPGLAAIFVGPIQAVILMGFFVASWLLSAWLFAKAAEEQKMMRTAP